MVEEQLLHEARADLACQNSKSVAAAYGNSRHGRLAQWGQVNFQLQLCAASCKVMKDTGAAVLDVVASRLKECGLPVSFSEDYRGVWSVNLPLSRDLDSGSQRASTQLAAGGGGGGESEALQTGSECRLHVKRTQPDDGIASAVPAIKRGLARAADSAAVAPTQTGNATTTTATRRTSNRNKTVAASTAATAAAQGSLRCRICDYCRLFQSQSHTAH